MNSTLRSRQHNVRVGATSSRTLSFGHFRSRPGFLVAAFTAFAFALLVSIAATHLHIDADEDAACAICLAFAGKIDTPAPVLPTVAVEAVGHLVWAAPAAQPFVPAAARLRPPSQGPPPRA